MIPHIMTEPMAIYATLAVNACLQRAARVTIYLGTMHQLNDIAVAIAHAKQCLLPEYCHSPYRDELAQPLQAVIKFLNKSA